ncbi:response regulator with CheY-like receiver, AAA-type ATPase, and DNA-binding domains [Caulobacter sp. AP07]|uniref:response regulator n=1 Tax=Caulobacter sp. AP07 TaxID=1144304 RepID=UPI000271DEEF|nr:response regulator [Caulobacter sp. AP07]EJL30992.1 response regulator with CheY-like receiver, AAA-type ATPase, and DNA-binding domains [Caulobacter sp. AP07]
MRFDLLKILLVDDNQHMRMLLTEILRALGVRHVFEALDGAEALQLLRGTPIDIVMTDLTMGPLDGIDFVNLLRNSPDSPDPFAPVIMITGHSTQRRVAEARDVGVNEFLAKPVTARGVIHRINLIIEHPRPYIRCETYFGPDRRRRQDPGFTGPWRRGGDPGVTEPPY